MNILIMTSAAPKVAPFYTIEKRPPLGVGLLISILKNAGHKVFFEDHYLAPTRILETNFLIDNQIQFIGIYANTICFQSTLAMLRDIQDLRERNVWRGKIILGGPHTSIENHGIPDFVDHIVIGEGEISLLEIVDGSETGRIVHGKPLQDMDNLPHPAWEEFIHRPYQWSDHWLNKSPLYTFNTSRGCPFDCTFCSVKSIWGKTYRYMSAERVINDVEYMQKYYGMRVAYFREDHFTLNKNRIIDFCELILSKGIELDWMCETRVDNLDDQSYLDLMAKAGCKLFYIGVESGSQRMLDFYQKGETVEQFTKAFDLSHRAGIKTYASFIVGAPTETEEDVKQTEELISRIKPFAVGRNVYVGLPGSDLYDYVRENDLYEYEDDNHVLYMKGHDKLIDRYHGGNPYLKIPSSSTNRKILFFEIKQRANGFYQTIKNKHLAG